MAVWRYRDCVSTFNVGGQDRRVRIHWIEHRRNVDNVELDYYEFVDGLDPVELDLDLVEFEAVQNSTHYLRWNHGNDCDGV
jgi:hypothetical protein